VPLGDTGGRPEVPATQVVRQVVQRPVPAVLDPRGRIAVQAGPKTVQLAAQMEK